MQSAALLWHVSLLVPDDRKGLALGMVGLVRFVPIVVFSMISGVVADAWDRRRLMLITQTAATVVALTLAFLTHRELTPLWVLYVMSGLSATIGAFDPPARQALVPMLVPREHLPNAISLNTVMIQAASVAGPAIGGVIIAVGNVGWAYAINSASFMCVVASLIMMRDVPKTERAAGDGARDTMSIQALKDGIHFVFTHPVIRSTMLLDFFATFFSSATALLPIFAQDLLHVGSRGYGWLYAAPAIGAVLASAAMVPITHTLNRRGQTLLWAVMVYGLATVVFGFSRSFCLTLACFAVSGAADAVSMIIRNIVRQLETPDAMRGRMVGINMIFFMGGPQLGELEAGLVANWIGAPLSVITGGIGCLLATGILAAVTPEVRHYQRGADGH